MSATTYATADDVHDDTIFQTSAHAISDAAVDARASAKAAARNVKAGVSQGAYKAAFGISFGVVFTGVFLTELLPESSSVRRGLEDGAGAALDAIDARKLAAEEQVDLESEAPHDSVPERAPPPSPRAPRARAAGTTAPARPPRKRVPIHQD